MRSLFLAILSTILILNVSMPLLANSEESDRDNILQTDFDSLKIGISTLSDIENLFGKPEKLRKGVEWHERGTSEKRTMYHAEYPSKGVSFSLFTNPSELYDITITTKDISISDLRIGETLGSVRKKLGEEGEWVITKGQDWWWLEFENHGLKIGFERNKKQKKYPISLANPKLVTRIEIYNNKISFSQGSGLEQFVFERNTPE